MENAECSDHRDSWSGWISNKVATAEAALTTALVGEQPVKARSLHNLRDAAKTAHLVREHRLCEQHTDDDNEVLPPVTRRASGIDIALSHAWGAVSRVAVAAMVTFEESVEASYVPKVDMPNDCRTVENQRYSSDPTKSPSSGCAEATSALSAMTLESINKSDSPVTDTCSNQKREALNNAPVKTGKIGWDAQTEISFVTASTSLSCADVSQNTDAFSTSTDSVEWSLSPELEDTRRSAVSSNEGESKNESMHCEVTSSTVNDQEDKGEGQDCEAESHSGCFSEEDLRELIDDFDVVFDRNGGADCVSRVKRIGDDYLTAMRYPAELVAAVEAELNDAKLILDDALQRLDCAIHTKVDEVYGKHTDASTAADSVIEEMKANSVCTDARRRNATLLQDCSRLLAVFATRTCASVLESVERDKDTCSWSERVERIASVSSRGIHQLRVISKRFADAIGQGRWDIRGFGCPGGLVRHANKVADAAVEHVVQCVALAMAALQVELTESAYQCCS